MMRKELLFRRALSCLLLIAFSTASWANFYYQDNGIRYHCVDDSKIATVIKKDNGYSGNVIIPNMVNAYGEKYEVRYIDGQAFYNCTNLTSVTIGEEVVSVGDKAFYGCSNLTSVTLNSQRIVSKAYSANDNLRHLFGAQVKEYHIGENVTSIGDYAFEGCSALTSVTIGEDVKTIGRRAFKGCSGLASVTIPQVTVIRDSAFFSCSALTSVTSYAKRMYYDASLQKMGYGVPTTGKDVFSGVRQSAATLRVPYSLLSAYSQAAQWKLFGTISPFNDSSWESIKYEAKTLASDDDAVAVGLLRDALETAKTVREAANEDIEALQMAIDQFKQNNASMESDVTSKVATDGWKKFDGTAADVCATQYAPAIETFDGRTGVQLAEVYENNGDRTGTILYQDITGLPNGTYFIGLAANAFSTSGRDDFECAMEDGAEDVAYVFANDQQAFIAAHIATSTTANDYYEIEAEVTDGTLRLGMGKAEGMDKSTNWHTMQICQLTCITTAKALYALDKAAMSALIAEAQSLCERPYHEDGKAALTEAITTAQAALEENKLNLEKFRAAIADLRFAVEDFKVGDRYAFEGTYYLMSPDGKYMAAGHDWGTRGIVNETGLDLIASTNDEGKVTLDSRVSNGNDNHFLGSNLYMDAEPFAWTVGQLSTAGYIIYNGSQYVSVDAEDNLVLSDTPMEWQFIFAEDVLEERMESLRQAREYNPVDVTWMLCNPGFNRNDQRVSAWQVSEDCTNNNLNGGNYVNNCAESWHSTFTVSQTLSSIPAGTYELTAQGFYRQDEGATEDVPVFFLGTQEQAMDEMGELPDANGNGKNDMSDASAAFSEGAYTISPLRFFLSAGESLTLGVKGTATQQWVIFDNFRLKYLGSGNVGALDEDWEYMKSKAESLASDDDAVAVGLLRDALAAAYAVTAPTSDDLKTLQMAIDQFNRNNSSYEESDETSKVATDGWKKFDGTPADVCATQYAPAIETYDGRTNVQLAEVFENNGDRTGTILYQDITGLQNGTYFIILAANAFSTSGRDDFECTMADGAEDVAYVFANDQQTFMTAHIATSTTTNDDYVMNVEVTDGTLRLGMGKAVGMDKSTNWHTMQIYELMCRTSAKMLYAQDKATMTALITEAQSLGENPYHQDGIEALTEAITTAQAALANNRLNLKEFRASIEALRTAMNDFQKANSATPHGTYYIMSPDGKFMAAGHDWGTRGIVNEVGLDLIATAYGQGKITLDSRVSNGGDNHFLGSNLYMDSEAIIWWVAPINETGYSISSGSKYIGVDAEDNLVLSDTPTEWRFVRAETILKARRARLSEATENNPVDVTWMLGNPGFNRNDQRVSAWQVSEDCTNKNLNGGNDVNNCGESFHSPFTISQTLSDIPAGTYELTAQGFYRQDEGATENIPVFFLGTQEQALDEKGDLPDANGNSRNDMSDASAAFSEGSYAISPLRFVVGEGESLTLGVRGTALQQWVIFDNFHLVYLGQTNATGISPFRTSPYKEQLRDGKYLENGHIVIVKNGKRYNVAGLRKGSVTIEAR